MRFNEPDFTDLGLLIDSMEGIAIPDDFSYAINSGIIGSEKRDGYKLYLYFNNTPSVEKVGKNLVDVLNTMFGEKEFKYVAREDQTKGLINSSVGSINVFYLHRYTENAISIGAYIAPQFRKPFHQALETYWHFLNEENLKKILENCQANGGDQPNQLRVKYEFPQLEDTAISCLPEHGEVFRYRIFVDSPTAVEIGKLGETSLVEPKEFVLYPNKRPESLDHEDQIKGIEKHDKISIEFYHPKNRRISKKYTLHEKIN